MLDKDKARIAELTAEEVKTDEEYKEKAKLLDKQIIQIQNSTKTSIPFLQRYHEKMRMRYQWYYKWHLWPYSRIAHFLILGVYLLALTLFGVHFFSSSNRVLAATTACTWTNGNSTGIWNDAANWSCGNVPTNANDVIFNGAVSNADITIDVAATAASFTVNDATSGGGNGVAGQATAENTGIHLNFSTNGANVAVSGAGVFSGYAWLDDVGWVAFGTADNADDGPVSENTSTGAVTGKAKILNDGTLIDFNAAPYGSNMVVNTGTGVFSGYAWSTSLGWINFTGVSLSSPAYTGTITANQNLTLDTSQGGTGDFYLGGGTYIANATTLTIAGNWTNNGTFTSGTGTVTLDGTATQTVTAGGTDDNHDLYNLTVTNASAAGVTFADALTLHAGGTFTDTTQDSKLTFTDNATYTFPLINIAGATGHNILMTKTAGSGHWLFNVPGTPSVTYVTTTSSDATGSGAAITGGTDGGNNTNWDFGAVVPNAPTILPPTVQSATSIRWAFADNSSNETGFKVYDGSNVLKATCVGVDFTYCDETGMAVNTLYNDRHVVAYNANGNSTNSATAAPIYTLANTPIAPTVNQIYGQPTQLQTIVGVNTNPASTQFAIQETQQSGNKYVQADGTLNTDAVWQTFAQWGSGTGTIITGLTAATQYTFQVKARNGDNTETAFGTPGAQQTTVGAGNTISGSLYDGIGGAKISAAKTIHVSVNGNAAATTETSSGDYTITANEPLDANDIITVFVSGETEKASTITKVSASGGLTGIDLYQNYTTIRHEGSIASIINTDLATADNISDTDLLVTVSGSTATFTQGVYVLATKTYAPGANVNVAGSWNNAGTFTAGTGTVTFNGTTTQTITGTNTWYNLTINNTYATPDDTYDVDPSSAQTVTNTFTIAHGQYSPVTGDSYKDVTINHASSHAILKPDAGAAITVSGNWNRPASGVFTANSGTVIFNGTTTQTISGMTSTNAWYNLIIANTAAAPSDTYDVDPSNAQTVTNTFLISDGQYSAYTGDSYKDISITSTSTSINGRLVPDAGANITVSGNWNKDVTGTFTAGTGRVTFVGTTPSTLTGSTTFYDLTMNTTGIGNKTITFPTGSGSKQVVSGTWTLDGDTGKVLTLVSATPATAWYFQVASAFTAGDYINVTDSWSANSYKITPGANSTNGGNNDGWLFNTAPNAPTLLGPAGYVDGTWQTDNTPTLTFNLTDPDGADQVKYEIIISTHSDFSSPTIDYTSDLGAQGARNYTASPALADGVYYWEVKTIDASNVSSSYSIAGDAGTADIKVDTTVPTTDIYLDPTDPNGTNSYYKTTAPTVTFTADDGTGSGASTIYYRWGATGDFSAYSTGIQAPEGTNTIYYYGTDLVGNSGVASPFSRQIKTDTVTPTVTATASPLGPNGSNNYYTGTAPTVTLSSSDTTSGLLNIQYKWDSGSYATYTTPLVAAEGTHTLYYYAVDNAGNTGASSPGSTTYNVDTGIPTVSVVADPLVPNGTNGYYITTAPTITLSAIDTGGSGVASIKYKWDSGSYATYATPLTASEGTHTLHYYSIDTAGNNSAEASEIFKTDLTNPTVDIYANPADPDGGSGYYKTAPEITFTGSDSPSGLENIYYHWDSNGDSTYTTGFNAPEGHHIIHYYAKDNAGNQTADITRDYYVDTNTPTVSVVTNPVSPNGSNSYFIGSSPIITLTGNDNTGSGIASIKYRWGATGDYSTYSGPITAPENINTLYYYATDNAGNSGSGSPSSTTIKLDSVLPTTDIYLNPTLPDGNNDYYTAAPKITFTSADGSGSGAGAIYYRWGAIGDFSVYSSELTAPEGTNTIYYYGTDLAGNSGVSSPISREIKVDSIKPTVSLANSDEPNTGIGWYKDMTPDITLTATDPGGSGISAIKYRWGTTDDYADYSAPVTAPEGVNTLYYYAIDNTGNSGDVNSSTYQVDSTTPLVSNITPVTTTPTNNLSLTFTWDEASDGGGSGIDHYLVTIGSTSGDNDIASNVSAPANSFEQAFATTGAYYIRIKAVDRVGHTSGYSNEGSVIIDQTSPSLTISNLIDGQYINTSEFTISGTASKDLVGLVGVFLQFDGGAWVKATSTNNFNDWSYLWQNYPDGTHTILVKATDNAGNTITSSQYIVIVDTTAPTKPETLRAFDVSDRIAGINQSFLYWQPSSDATSGLKEYQIFRDGSQIATTKDNYFVDEKLSPQSYTYKVNAVDMTGLSTFSDEAKVELVAKGTYTTVISDVKADPSKIVSEDDKTTALITWKTSGPATTLVNYGLGGAKANKSTIDNKLNMGHTVVLPDLKPNTTYHFSVVSKDIYGNQVESGDQTFTTAVAPTKETIWDVILKTVQRSFEWFRKAMASPILEKISLIRAPEQVGLNEMVFDVSIAEIQKYQSFIVVSGRTGMTLSRSTDGNVFNQLATTDKNYYFDQNLSANQTYFYKVEGIEGVISLRPGSADPSAAVISDIKSKDLVITKDNAEVMISWNTDKLTTSELEINSKVQKGDFQNQSHAMVVTSLKPGQTYHYKIKATTSEGVASETPDRTLATASAPVKETIWQTILKTLQNSLNQFSNWMRK